MAEIALAAQLRQSKGSSSSRRLRGEGKIPGVLYGHGIEPTPLSVVGRELRIALNGEAGTNALISLELEGKKHLALARELQRHPVRNTVAHVDFQIVSRNEAIVVEVPLNFVGEATGVTKNGGIVEHLVTSIEVSATPTTIPSNLDVDISQLQLDGAIRIKDIKLPSGVTATHDAEEAIVIGAAMRGAATPSEAEAETAAEG